MAHLVSVNLAVPRPNPAKRAGITGIDKQPTTEPVTVRPVGPKGTGASGLAGDRIYDVDNHGGDDQAVYAYAREDLDSWAAELDRTLPSGVFGENLTTEGVDVTRALIGERWHIGPQVVLQVTEPRIPCGTFAYWMNDRGWIKRFIAAVTPGAYLRVISSGDIRVGDRIEVRDRPVHEVTIGMVFRAVTVEPELLPRLLDADALTEDVRGFVTRRIG